MSLLDDVSIVVTPNGYKAGELYSVVPVPIEGAEMLSQPVDLVTDFLVNSGGVIVDADTFTTAGGTFDGIRINSFFTIGKRYKLIIDGDTTSSGFTIGETTLSGNEYGSGFGTHYFTPIGTGSIWLRQQTAGTTNITSFSIKEYTAADMDVTRATAATRVDEDGLVNYAEVVSDTELITNGDFATDTDWIKGTGWTISGGAAILDGTQTGGSSLSSSNMTVTVGKIYKVTVNVSATSSGFRLYDALGVVSYGLSLGENIFYRTPSSSTYTLTPLGLGGAAGTISNVSVKQVDRDNVPRIDYTGGGCPHILAEPQRTNLITYSEDFSQSYWTKQSGVTPTYNTTETLSPDGTYNATKFIGNGSSGVLKGGISVTGVIARSVYLKSITGTVNVVLKDPNLTVTQKTLTLTEEWQRFELIESNGTSTQGIWIDDIPASGIYVYGAQVEEGSYATSYIPTDGGTVTRNQDQFTRDGIGSLINSTEGVLFVEMAALSDDGTFRQLTLNDGTTANRILVDFTDASNQIRVFCGSGGVSQVSETFNVTSSLSFNKIAFKYKLNDFALWVNGVEVATDTSGITPIGLNKLSFNNGSGSFDFFGKVKQLQVYNTALTDTQLAALTS